VRNDRYCHAETKSWKGSRTRGCAIYRSGAILSPKKGRSVQRENCIENELRARSEGSAMGKGMNEMRHDQYVLDASKRKIFTCHGNRHPRSFLPPACSYVSTPPHSTHHIVYSHVTRHASDRFKTGHPDIRRQITDCYETSQSSTHCKPRKAQSWVFKATHAIHLSDHVSHRRFTQKRYVSRNANRAGEDAEEYGRLGKQHETPSGGER
jgi:hypothetical protein